MRRSAVFSVLLILLSSCIGTFFGVSTSSQTTDHPEKTVEAHNGIVAAAHPLASEAGLAMLKQGGNAVDAAVAASFMISVVRPQSTGIGGGGFLVLYRKPENKVRIYDFRERAPLAASNAMFVNKDGSLKNFTYEGKNLGPASTDGPLAVGVPGLVAGLVETHQKYGTLPLAQVIAPAIAVAEKGFPVYAALSESIQRRKSVLIAFPESRKIFLPKDKVPLVGDLLIQEDLAQTLRLIASQGKDIFYRGAFASALTKEMMRTNGLITQKDLSTYKVQEREPIEGQYRSYRIVGMPPPSSGGIHIIEIFNILANDPVGTLGHNSVPYLHLLTEAMRRAFADRAAYLGDPAFFKVPLKGLLAKDYGIKVRQTIDLEKATPSRDLAAGNPYPYESPSTTHISVVDQWGNAVSTTQTINANFGSGMTVAGVVLNNEMDDFSVKPGAPNVYGLVGNGANAIEPGKTMLSSMSPSLVFDEQNNLKWILGSPGGPRIITATLQTILNLIDFKMPLAEAVNATRIHHQWLPDEIAIEEGGLPESVIKALEFKGHKLAVSHDTFGDVEAIGRLENGNWVGVSDRRSDGKPFGF